MGAWDCYDDGPGPLAARFWRTPLGNAISDKNWKILESRSVAPGGSRVVCVANQKGGVAKTTTAVNLGASLAQRGHRTLVVDVDPQANATTGLGIDHRSVGTSTYELLLHEATLDDVVMATAIENLYCAPASLDLAGAEIELVGTMAREHKLKEALGARAAEFAVVLLDCPPSLGLLTLNALAAAQDLIVPVQCEYYALEGLGQLLGTAERVRKALNPNLRIAGFLLTMYDARTKLSSQVSDEVRSHFGGLVYRTVIPRSVRLSEAPSFGEPVLTLDPSSRGAIAYKLLAAEVETRYGLSRVGARETRSGDGAMRPGGEPPRAGRPGPGGRGYGTVTPEPSGLVDSFPPRHPWSTETEAAR